MAESPQSKENASKSFDFAEDAVVKPKELFFTRESKELIIAFSGPVGSGVNEVIESATDELTTAGYEVVNIKLSDFINILTKKFFPSAWKDLSGSLRGDRYATLQKWGNELRKKYQADILAEIAISRIASHRLKKNPEAKSLEEIEPKRTAYLIDQLKNPAEIELLRTVYGNIFFVLGVLCGYVERKARLMRESVNPQDAEDIMERDRREHFEHGQQLDRTLKLSDYFIRNSNSSKKSFESQIKRFIYLIHGVNGITPTTHEYAMYCAQAAGLKSSCLSRQVGAAIADQSGHVISTGCNDVPRPGGGLYSEADGVADGRCFNMGGVCANDRHKRTLRRDIEGILKDPKKKWLTDTARSTELAEELYKNTRVRDLIEFSRSVHAEMDAIVSAARKGGAPLENSYLYTTTFPCHNCARHIITAGIKKVFFIEPYEKSLAIDLHGEAIDLEPAEIQGDHTKVQFIHFEGVAPRQYLNFFSPKAERKDKNGRAVKVVVAGAKKVVPQLLDGYKDMESKVTDYLSKELDLSPDDIAGTN